MGFEQLKAKLGGNESDTYAITEDTILEWIGMEKEDKILLINDAKEKGGELRENLLAIDYVAKALLEADEEQAAAWLEKLKGAGAAAKQAAKSAYEGIKGGLESGGQKVSSGLQTLSQKAAENPKMAVGTAAVPASLAAGLGAVALAKKMRAAKKAGA